MRLNCAAPGCLRHRRKRGRYCARHARRLNRYASPEGRPIPAATLVSHAVAVRRLFEAHPDHPGVKMAIAEVAALLSSAVAAASRDADPLPETKHLARLAAADVEPVNILAMVCAVGLAARDDRGSALGPKGMRFAAARAVCGLLPLRGIKLGSRALDAVGELVWDRFVPFVATVVDHFDKKAAEPRRRTAALTTPFTIHRGGS